MAAERRSVSAEEEEIHETPVPTPRGMEGDTEAPYGPMRGDGKGRSSAEGKGVGGGRGRRSGAAQAPEEQQEPWPFTTAARLDTMERAYQNLSEATASNAASLVALRATMDAATTAALGEVNDQFGIHQAALTRVVQEARAEFDVVKRDMNALFGGTGDGFRDVVEKVRTMEGEIASLRDNPRYVHPATPAGDPDMASRVTALEQELINLIPRVHPTGYQEMSNKIATLEREVNYLRNAPVGGGGGGQGHQNTRGFLPLKNQVPKTFGKIEADWRNWHEDMAVFLEASEQGIGDVLKAVAKRVDEADEGWLRHNHPTHSAKSADLHRCLRTLTEGEARMVVMGVKTENGFEAWRLLHQRYGLATAARQGQAMAEVTAMVARPCKTPAETRARVVELERRIRITEEVTGQPLDDNHAKSILAAVLDPTTRAHTTTLLGVNTSYQALKRGVLEFAANNAAVAPLASSSGPTPMDIGACVEQQQQAQQHHDQHEEWEDENLAAITMSTKCHCCGGMGHIAAQCPSSKGKGKGSGQKGKGKSNGQQQSKGHAKGGGKSKGPAKGCWTCGGSHFQQDCPQHHQPSKGYFGKGAGKAFAVQEWPSLGEVRALCQLKTVKTSNRFAALSEPDTNEATTGAPQHCASNPASAGVDGENGNSTQVHSVTSSRANAGVWGSPSGTPQECLGCAGGACNSFSGRAKVPTHNAMKGSAKGEQSGRRLLKGTLVQAVQYDMEQKMPGVPKVINNFADATRLKKQEVSKVLNKYAGMQAQNVEKVTIANRWSMRGIKEEEEEMPLVMPLMPLMTIEPEKGEIKEGEWERVDFAVDSGASETVMPPHVLRDIAVEPSDASRRGVLYEVANGERIPNMGERNFQAETHFEGIQRKIKAQVCQVSKPLLSVAKLVRAGNTVVFAPEGSFVHDPISGESMQLQEASGMYTLSLWTKTTKSVGAGF